MQNKRIYISADYDIATGDTIVINELKKWNDDNRYNLNFVDMATVRSGSVSDMPDCRICDLKKEFNRQIKGSSRVIIIIGDRTSSRQAGTTCDRSGASTNEGVYCTPYKSNALGSQKCKIVTTASAPADGDIGVINQYSYIRHEFEQAKRLGKKIIVLYNSLRKEKDWLPSYMSGYQEKANPFWKYDERGFKVGNYELIKKEILDV